MPVEVPNTIHDLRRDWPLGADQRSTADDHHRITKGAIRDSFPAPGEQRWDNFQINTGNGWAGTDPVIHNQPPLQGAVIPGMGGFFWRGGLIVPTTLLAPGTIAATFPGNWGPSETPVHDVICTMQGWVNTSPGSPTFVSFGVSFTKNREVKVFPPRVAVIGGQGEGAVYGTNATLNMRTSFLYFFGSGVCFR